MPTTVVAAGAAVAQVEWHGGVQVDVVAIGGRSVSEGGPSLEARGGGGAGGGGPRHWLRTVRSIGVGFNRGGADVLRTYLVVRVSVLPSWGLRGARRNRSRILRAARRAVCRRSAWPASLRFSCCRMLCRPFGGGGIRWFWQRANVGKVSWRFGHLVWLQVFYVSSEDLLSGWGLKVVHHWREDFRDGVTITSGSDVTWGLTPFGRSR
jgi:hypothetical protein